MAYKFFICDALHDLVPFTQFKKREKTLTEECNFTKSNNPHLVECYQMVPTHYYNPKKTLLQH